MRRHLTTGIAAIAAVAYVACEAPEPAEPEPVSVARTADGVEYSATTALLASYPVRLRTTATATNRTTRDVVLRFPDDCPVLVRALARNGEPRWDQAGHEACGGAPTVLTLAAGASATFETELTAPDILGDSLPDDVYVLVAQLRPVGHPAVMLSAGRANLVVPRNGER
jgi:hypothetical protein